MSATLYLIPTPLGDLDTFERSAPQYNNEIIHQLDVFIVEQLRTARRFLRKSEHPVPIDEMTFFELNKHTPVEQIATYLNLMAEGKSIGLLSEAGTPCIADPGAIIVQMAHERNIPVVPLVGASSIILSLMASGFNGQSFVFHGYLPVDKNALVKKVREMEEHARRFKQTQIFIETPYRNNNLLEVLLQNCQPKTFLSIAADITTPTEYIRTKKVMQWKKETVNLHKRPTVFLLYQ